jgi:hydroxymethylbilane synthase
MTGTDLAPTRQQDTSGVLQRQADSPLAAYVGRVLPDLRIRIGSRTSPMAMAQANHVRDRLTGLLESLEVEIVGIETSGDRWQGDLAELGGKGAFLKEIDRHLVMGGVDIAVHCLTSSPA